MRCSLCGFRIRGKNHIKGNNHLTKTRTFKVPKSTIVDNKEVKRTRFTGRI